MPRSPSKLLFATVTAVAASLLLAACSGPLQPPQVASIEFDGFEATIELADVSVASLHQVDCGGHPLPVTLYAGRLLGAEYAFYLPRDWQPADDLVLFARGYLPPSLEPGFPEELPEDLVALQCFLLGQGFALGASSYAANGYAVQEGMRDTHLLNALFRWHTRLAPERTYLVGQSMGGLIVVGLVEIFPHRYAAALPVCGPVGGSLLQLDYVGHVRVLAGYFFPELFMAAAFEEPAIPYQDFAAFAGTVAAQAQENPDALRKLASIRHPRSTLLVPGGVPLLPGSNHAEWTQALIGALYYYVVGIEDVLARGGGVPFGNQLLTYVGSELTFREALRLNRRVERVRADPNAVAHWAAWYQPSGRLQRPVISLHTAADPDVPALHEAVYAQLVARAGASGHLRTVVTPSFGHCEFDLESELAPAFLGLVNWVETGTVPQAP